MAVKRRAKKGAVASTMWCSGSNQATCKGASPSAPGSAIVRKRTNAFILCMSRRTAWAISSARSQSGSSGSARSPGSTWKRQSSR